MRLTDFMVQYMDTPSIKDSEFYIRQDLVTINNVVVLNVGHFMENTSRVKINDFCGSVIKEVWFCVGKEN